MKNLLDIFSSWVYGVKYDELDELVIMKKVDFEKYKRKLGLSDFFLFYKDKAGKYRYRRTALNNEIVAASTQGYVDFDDCINNAVRCGFSVNKHASNLKKK